MSSETQFCLRWNNYGSTLTSSLNSLYKKEEFVDVTIVAEDIQLKAHKVILSACSPYFQNILKNNPCQHPIIILKEVSSEDLLSVISFIYEGEVNVNQKRLHTFMKLAEALQVRGLTDSSSPVPKENQEKIAPNKEIEERPATTLDLTTNKRCSLQNQPLPPPLTNQPLSLKSTLKRSYEIIEEVRLSPVLPLDSPSSQDSSNKRSRSSVSPELVIPLCTISESPKENESKLSREQVLPTLESPIKVEQCEEDSDEGKENGSNYSLRRGKARPSKSDSNPPIRTQGKKSGEDLEGNSPSQPILTVPQRASPASTNKLQPVFPQDSSSCQNLPYPCPFCEKSYTSWGFRRRHIKGYHTGTPELPCKWCFSLLPTHVAWEDHVTGRHHLSLNDARNGILILEEAHMVLQIAQPLRIESLMDLAKDSKNAAKEDKKKSSNVTTSSK